MSRFLNFFPIPIVCVCFLFWASGCCYGTNDEIVIPSLEFIIVDQAGENVLLSNTLPANVIWYYREGVKGEAVNPYADYNRGVFVINAIPRNNYTIDIINQSFAQLDLTYQKQKGQCGTYEQISGVSINGVAWDYHSKPILTLVYNP